MTEPLELPAAPVEVAAPGYDEAPVNEPPEDGDAEPTPHSSETTVQGEPQLPEGDSQPGSEPAVTAEPPPPPKPAPPLPEPPTWEGDENATTFFLRALFTLGAGAFLVWSQMQSLVAPGAHWGQWVASAS